LLTQAATHLFTTTRFSSYMTLSSSYRAQTRTCHVTT